MDPLFITESYIQNNSQNLEGIQSIFVPQWNLERSGSQSSEEYQSNPYSCVYNNITNIQVKQQCQGMTNNHQNNFVPYRPTQQSRIPEQQQYQISKYQEHGGLQNLTLSNYSILEKNSSSEVNQQNFDDEDDEDIFFELSGKEKQTSQDYQTSNNNFSILNQLHSQKEQNCTNNGEYYLIKSLKDKQNIQQQAKTIENMPLFDDLDFSSSNSEKYQYSSNENSQYYNESSIQQIQQNSQQRQPNNMHKQQQVHQLQYKKIKKSDLKDRNQINTSHVPNNMLNLLTKYLSKIYQNKLLCEITPNKQYKTHPMVLKQNKCTCKRCQEFKLVLEVKYTVKKNLNWYKKMVNQSQRMKYLIEDFLVNKVSLILLEKKNSYRSHETFVSLYQTLYSFLYGLRNPENFRKVLI